MSNAVVWSTAPEEIENEHHQRMNVFRMEEETNQKLRSICLVVQMEFEPVIQRITVLSRMQVSTRECHTALGTAQGILDMKSKNE